MRADSTGTGTGTHHDDAHQRIRNRINWTNSTGTMTLYLQSDRHSGRRTISPPATAAHQRSAPVPSQFTAYMLVNTPANLQAIGTNTSTLSQNYALGPPTST